MQFFNCSKTHRQLCHVFPPLILEGTFEEFLPCHGGETMVFCRDSSKIRGKGLTQIPHALLIELEALIHCRLVFNLCHGNHSILQTGNAATVDGVHVDLHKMAEP